MAELKVYEVTLNGMTVHLQLSEEDAKNYPDAKAVTTEQRRGKARKSASTKKADPPSNKSGS